MLKFADICIERPVGTDGNNRVILLLKEAFSELNYGIRELPFDCKVWQPNRSFAEQDNKKSELYPGPFSGSIKGSFPVKYISSLTELKEIESFGGILIFKDELTKAALFPKNFPFYFPDEDKMKYEIIENINPKGIIAISGKDPVSGLNPFPVFEDANFKIPTAYVSALENITEAKEISIEINSTIRMEKSKQIIFRKEGKLKDIILISAHMDSKYSTDGAVDNASGLYTLYETAKLIKTGNYNNTMEIVPFNGEESPEVPGQLAYLNYLRENNLNVKLVINIDGVGGSENVFSFYNFDKKKKSDIIAKNKIREGGEWYSGDHGMFAFQGIPCIAVSADTMFTELMNVTHTKNDKMELVDCHLLENLSGIIANIIKMADIE